MGVSFHKSNFEKLQINTICRLNIFITNELKWIKTDFIYEILSVIDITYFVANLFSDSETYE